MSRNERLRLNSISTGIPETFLIPDTTKSRQYNYEPNCPFMHHFTSVLVVFLHAQMEGIFLQKQRTAC